MIIRDILRIFEYIKQKIIDKFFEWGCYGIDCNVNGSTTRRQSKNVLKYLQNNKRQRRIIYLELRRCYGICRSIWLRSSCLIKPGQLIALQQNSARRIAYPRPRYSLSIVALFPSLVKLGGGASHNRLAFTDQLADLSMWDVGIIFTYGDSGSTPDISTT